MDDYYIFYEIIILIKLNIIIFFKCYFEIYPGQIICKMNGRK